jgi:hypothetical protein
VNTALDLSALRTDTDALAAYQAGATLPQLARAMGLNHAATIRHRLVRLAGGPAAWAALVAVHGTSIIPRAAAAPVDDTATPRLADTTGWTVTWILEREVFTAPDGTSYVRATEGRPADLIREPKTRGLPVLRLKLFNLVKATRKAAKTHEERTAQVNAAVARRRAKRARKARAA